MIAFFWRGAKHVFLFLGVDSFPSLFNHRSFQKPAVSHGLSMVS